MDAKTKARCAELLAVMDDARRRQVTSHVDSVIAGCDSITGRRRYATYERQHDRYSTAAAKLAALINEA